MTEFDLSTREGRWKHFGSVDPIEEIGRASCRERV